MTGSIALKPWKAKAWGAALLLSTAAATPALAQPADLPILPATTTQYPDGIKIGKSAIGPVYVNKKGQTLYGMDLRTLIRWSSDPALFCQAECAAEWEPMLAPAESKANIMYPRGFGERRPKPGTPPPALPEGFVAPQSAPDWTIIAGPAGLQWVYKGWHMVYVHKGSKKGAADFDGKDQLTWNALRFVPPVPQITGPVNVSTVFTAGAYALANKDGNLLYTGTCTTACADWKPLAGGMASRSIGEWAVSNGDDQPQWTYRGQPVFVSKDDDPANVPAGAAVLRP